MRLRQGHASGGNKRPFWKKTGTRVALDGLSSLVAATAIGYLALSNHSSAELPAAKPAIASSMKPAKPPPKKTVSELNWKKTHLIVFTGNADEQDTSNTLASAKAGLENKAAGVYLAGFKGKLDGTRQYGSSIDSDVIGRVLADVKGNYSKGDAAVVYITGNPVRKAFAAERGDPLDHQYLPKMLGKMLGGKIIVVSDKHLCVHFMEALTASKSFTDITVIDPGPREESPATRKFSPSFWHALGEKMDFNDDGISHVKEAFSYGMRECRKSGPNAFGTYRQPIRKIKSMKEAEDGVIMVTADWCSACKRMEPVFRKANTLIRGSSSFFLIDKTDSETEMKIPTVFVKGNGQTVSQTTGSRSLDDFVEWLEGNGAENDISGCALNLGPEPKVKELDTEGTFYALIINGDSEERHSGNVVKAYEALNANCITDIFLVTLSNGKASKARVAEAVAKIKEKITEKDSLFVYVTGHGSEDGFVLQGDEVLKHGGFISLLSDFKDRESVYLFDCCYSGAVPPKLIASGFNATAMAPVVEGNVSHCHLFSPHFWAGIKEGKDTNGDGKSTLEEVFRHAIEAYNSERRKMRLPLSSGSFVKQNK